MQVYDDYESRKNIQGAGEWVPRVNDGVGKLVRSILRPFRASQARFVVFGELLSLRELTLAGEAI